MRKIDHDNPDIYKEASKGNSSLFLTEETDICVCKELSYLISRHKGFENKTKLYYEEVTDGRDDWLFIRGCRIGFRW